MIIPGNGSQWGIKDSGINITTDIHNIINMSNDFIIVCGYNFSPHHDPTSIISHIINKKQVGTPGLIIMPPNMWGYGRKNHTLNIQHLINNQIGVILNTKNHSKWLITDYGFYYGSMNFSKSSMTTKVEIVTLCDALKNNPVPWWMKATKKELLEYSVNELSMFNTNTRTTNLGTINTATLTTLRLVLGLILRYNPEIEKVQKTLDNYEEVRIKLSSIIDNYFSLISLKDLNLIWNIVNKTIYTLDKLAYQGNDILIKNESQSSIQSDISAYNKTHTAFVKQIEQIMNLIEQKRLKYNIQEDVINNNKKIEDILRDIDQ